MDKQVDIKFKKNENLIGRYVEIQLEVFDLDIRHKLGQSVPALPKIEGKLLKRCLTWTWTYMAELKEPMFLDIDGIPEETRKKISAYYIWISPSYALSSDELNRRDNIYLQIKEKGKIRVGVFYLENPDSAPSELAVGKELASFTEATPTIGGGIMILKK